MRAPAPMVAVGRVVVPDMALVAEAPGTVVEVAVTEGETVTSGQLLVQIEDPDREEALRSADEAMAAVLAKVDAERATGAPDAETVASLMGEVEAAWERVMAAADGVDHLDVRAPFDGRVSRVDVGRGESVATGARLVDLVAVDGWLVEAEGQGAPDAGPIGVGDPAMITLDAVPGVRFLGRVVRVDRASEDETSNAAYSVTVRPAATDDRWGRDMSAEVTLLPGLLAGR